MEISNLQYVQLNLDAPRVEGKGRHLGKYVEPLDEKSDSTVMLVR